MPVALILFLVAIAAHHQRQGQAIPIDFVPASEPILLQAILQGA